MNWIGMVFLLAVILCILIVGCHMMLMSGVGHLTGVRGALFVKLSLMDLSASVCDGKETYLRLE